MSIDIKVDNRERGLKVLFEKHGVSHTCQNLEIGDIVLSKGTMSLIFERKTFDDLRASIKDGRYHDQKRRLLQSYHKQHVYYILEGIFKYSDDDEIIKSAMINTTIRDGIGVFRTSSLEDTFHLLKSIVQRVDSSPEKYVIQSIPGESSPSEHNAGCHLKPSALATHKHETTYVNMLCQIPNVSLKTAKAIEALYPTFQDLMHEIGSLCEEEKLKKLKHITTTDAKGSKRRISSAAVDHIINSLFKTRDGKCYSNYKCD